MRRVLHVGICNDEIVRAICVAARWDHAYHENTAAARAWMRRFGMFWQMRRGLEVKGGRVVLALTAAWRAQYTCGGFAGAGTGAWSRSLFWTLSAQFACGSAGNAHSLYCADLRAGILLRVWRTRRPTSCTEHREKYRCRRTEMSDRAERECKVMVAPRSTECLP